MKRVSPMQVLRVFHKERRIERIKAKRKKISSQIHELEMQIEELCNLDDALSEREGRLIQEVEFSGVYDDAL